MSGRQYIKSPLNYVGGKYKILDQIMPLFPDNIGTFVDLFGGGFNVGINATAEHYVYNDIVEPLCGLMRYFAEHTSEEVISTLEQNIQACGLSKTNEDAFRKLRDRYNTYDYESEEEKAIDFYSLILYSFNYQIRFNQKMGYNTPFGKNRSSYNESIKKNLIRFVDKIHSMDITIENLPFTEVDLSSLNENDFVYCDPPYLITTGSYNDGNRGIKDWTKDDEQELLSLLDDLNDRRVRFALSNATQANGQKNEMLIQWAGRYTTHIISNTFNNSNYHRQHKGDLTEVLITNY